MLHPPRRAVTLLQVFDSLERKCFSLRERGQCHSQFAVVATPIEAVCHLLFDNQLPLLTSTVTFPHIYEPYHVLHIYTLNNKEQQFVYIKVNRFC